MVTADPGSDLQESDLAGTCSIASRGRRGGEDLCPHMKAEARVPVGHGEMPTPPAALATI